MQIQACLLLEAPKARSTSIPYSLQRVTETEVMGWILTQANSFRFFPQPQTAPSILASLYLPLKP